LITSAGYNFATAEAALNNEQADLVAFGKDFISNPDLVERYALDAALNPYDMATFYGGTASGYTDYPFLLTK
jgi:N-ethylmaleimide reductase